MNQPETVSADEQFLRRVAYFCASLAEWYEDEAVPDVLFSLQKRFGDRRSIDMLQTEEGADELECNFAALRDGAFV